MTSRKRVQFSSNLPSRTQQHFKDQCNINSILDRYKKTGHLSHVRGASPQYGDFSLFTDLKSSIDKVSAASESFNSLPAPLRKRFQNDPTRLIDFVSNPSNYQEAASLGLVPKVIPEAPKNDDSTTNNINIQETNTQKTEVK